MPLVPLPIDPLLPELIESLKARPNLVLEADPGAGKTTRVPRALLDAGLLVSGECWILEPRRLAARLAATRVAEELGEPLGQRVGYAVRFEQKVSKATRLRFVTEGLLLRRLASDPDLTGIAAVILDEFHERSLPTDSALALLRRLQRASRPDLKLIVMSATLDAEPVAAFLDAPRLRSEGRAHPVAQRHLPRPDDRPLPVKVKEALEGRFREGLEGDVLVFLPGAGEIRACLRECEELGRRAGWRLLPLHGELSWEAQAEVLAPHPEPTIIFSTNVAESSVTLPRVRVVIDSGLARTSTFDAWTGLGGLRLGRISQARCIQRAGRAGRTAPGLCLRLFTEAEFRAREPFDAPEILRADLAELSLQLHALGARDVAWLDAPPAQALEAAESLLARLGAFDTAGALTHLGRRLVRLPLHPRLARLLTAAEDLGIGELGALAAALLEAGELEAKQTLDRREATGPGTEADLLLKVDAYREAEAAQFGAGALRAAGLDAGAVHRARQAFQSHRRLVTPAPEPADAEARLRQALLAAFPDRLARRGEGRSLQLLEGGGAVLDERSRVRGGTFLVALEALAEGAKVKVTDAALVEPDWILEAFPEDLSEERQLRYDAGRRRVEAVERLKVRELILDESKREADPAMPGVTGVLVAAALADPLPEAWEALLLRLAFLRTRRPELSLPEDLRRPLLEAACAGQSRLGAALDQDPTWLVAPAFGEAVAHALPKVAPTHTALLKRRLQVNYDGERPWIESRLQDFLGLKEGPAVDEGRLPLVLHLLAPNYRAVQVTTDLAGFWQRAYQEVRGELSRRYPRHFWPERPAEETEPPEPKGRR
ncbi:MAG TPA: ATP-dependent helicase HrpB [Holophagaceae bacterium]|nr:ATP-dependent helicase HrpB [Holophagaceae bacterium]